MLSNLIRKVDMSSHHSKEIRCLTEIRFTLQSPFPLYPGETLVGAERFTSTGSYKEAVQVLPAIKQNHAVQVS